MSSDDFDPKNDKTVFRQPTGGGNQTVIKPVPGGRMPGSNTIRPASIAPRETQYNAPRVDLEAAYFRTTRGLNPLVNAATVLLGVFEQTRQAVSHPDVGRLHQRLVNEIKSFEMRVKELGIPSEIVLSSRYIMCTILDEAVLNTPWGCESAWHQKTLLSIFHNEASGGEKFYVILNRLRESPSENLYILELFYICLSLGFEGKYRLMQRGKDSIDNIRDELFSIIRRHRGEYERDLSPNWRGLGRINNSLAQYIPLWVVASVVGALLFLSYSGFRYWLYNSSVPVVVKLENISNPETIKKRIRFQ